MKQNATILGCSVVSGILFCLCLPLGEQAYLAPVAFAPLFASVRKTRFVVGFVAALVTIFVAAKLSETGVFYREKFFSPDANAAWIYSGYGLFGVPVALVAALFAEPKLQEWQAWKFAGLAAIGESALEFYLPAHLALSQYRSGGVMLLTSIIGIYGISALLWWANLWLAQQPFKEWLWAAPILLVFDASLSAVPLPASNGTPLKVALLQVPVDDDAKIVESMQEAKRQRADLAVWPEFGGIIFQASQGNSKLRKVAEETVPFVTSYPDNSRPKPFNVASLFEAMSESGFYRKQHLFGGESQQHLPGSATVAVPFSGIKLGLLICFDSCFQDITRKTVNKDEADLIALPTIDPIAPHHFLAAIHSSYTPFRSAESGVSIVRADANAFSMVTDSWGRIGLITGAEQGVFVHKVWAEKHWTVLGSIGLLYRRPSSWLVFFVLLRHLKRASRSGRTAPSTLNDLR